MRFILKEKKNVVKRKWKSMFQTSLSPDPFFAFLFSFFFVRDTNLAHPIKIVHYTPLFSHRHRLGLKRQMKKNAKMQDICNKETKTTAASLVSDYSQSI